MVSAMLKTAVVAPIPSASESTAANSERGSAAQDAGGIANILPQAREACEPARLHAWFP